MKENIEGSQPNLCHRDRRPMHSSGTIYADSVNVQNQGEKKRNEF